MNKKSLILAIMLFAWMVGLAACSPWSNTTQSSYILNASSSETISFWRELRKSFKLNHYTYYREVQTQIHWFLAHQAELKTTLNHAAPYLYYIYQETHARNLPGEIVLLPVIESSFDPWANSNKGATGLWQLMPRTAKGFGIKRNWWFDGRRDIAASTKAALTYFTYLNTYFNGNWPLSIAAYNAGEGTVGQAMQTNTKLGRNTQFWYLPLPHETRNYVPRLLALAAIIAHPGWYGINLPEIKNGPYFAVITIGAPIKLEQAAKLAHISLDEMYALNPGYNHETTDPHVPCKLLLPIDKVTTFRENLAKLPRSSRTPWKYHKVQRGETLTSLAKQCHSSSIMLKQINALHSSHVHKGEVVLIPNNSINSKQNNLSSATIPQIRAVANIKQNAIVKKQQASTTTTYKVRRGDTLEKIAKHYRVKTQQLEILNHITRNQILSIGKIIIISDHSHRS